MTKERLEEIREVARNVSDRSVIPELLVEIDALNEIIDAKGVHSCHSKCANPVCVMRRERDQLRAENIGLLNALDRLNGQVSRRGLKAFCTDAPLTVQLAKRFAAMERVVEKCALGECNDTLTLQLHKELDSLEGKK